MIDHNTEDRQRWISNETQQYWLRKMRLAADKYAAQKESPRVSIQEDDRLELSANNRTRVGIILGASLMLAWVVLLGWFPAVCG